MKENRCCDFPKMRITNYSDMCYCEPFWYPCKPCPPPVVLRTNLLHTGRRVLSAPLGAIGPTGLTGPHRANRSNGVNRANRADRTNRINGSHWTHRANRTCRVPVIGRNGHEWRNGSVYR
jgi:hypothetical protein